MTHYQIHSPIWNGGERCVGLNVELLHGVNTTFEILYTTKKTKKRSYPYTFTVPTAVVYGCQRQEVSGGVVLAIVPLELCTEVKPIGRKCDRCGEPRVYNMDSDICGSCADDLRAEHEG